jgi:diguanylate cyclase (GGDEF)-like protein
MLHIKYIFTLIAIIACGANSHSSTLVLAEKFLQVELWPHSRVLIDTDNQLKFADILLKQDNQEFLASENVNINQGISATSYWLSFSLHNPTDQTIEWVIQPDNTYLDYLHLYFSNDKQNWQMKSISDYQPFSDRDIPYRTLNIRHKIEPNSKVFFLVNMGMYKADTVNLRLLASDTKSFEGLIHEEQFFYGIYFGICLTLIILSALLWLLLKQVIYFGYFFYLICNTLFWVFLTGYSFSYLLPNKPMMINDGFHIVFLLLSISAIYFSRIFLETNNLTPRLDKLLIGILGFLIISIPIRLLGYYVPVMYISFFALFILTLLPILGFYCYIKGADYAKWYIAAWLVYALGILISWISATSNLFEWGMQPLIYTQVASLLESFLLSIALIEKISQLNLKIELITEKSQRDELTGLGNRRLLNLQFQNKSQHDYHKRLWVVLLDIDHFKSINDQYGHLAGDKILKVLASVMKQHSRSEDSVIRYGGEEFILLLNAQDKAIVFTIAERIRLYFSKHETQFNGIAIHHTLSQGIAEVDFHHDTPLEQAIEMADQALYHAKDSGRNCIAYSIRGKCDLIPAKQDHPN